MQSEDKLEGWLIPPDERYKIIGTSDNLFYIFDYRKFTTVKDDDGKEKMFHTSMEVHSEREALIAAYRRAIEAIPPKKEP